MHDIYKFGGTSVNNIKSIDLIMKKLNEFKNDIVIISAFRGVTDLLVDIYDSSIYNTDTEKESDVEDSDDNSVDSNDSNKIKEFYSESDKESVNFMVIIKKLKSIHAEVINHYFKNNKSIISEINNLIEKTSLEYLDKPKDYRICLGEHLSFIILSYIFRKNNIKFTGVLSKDILVQKNRRIDYDLSKEKLSKIHFENNFLLTTGFVIYDLDGRTVTNLGRGGSDYTATIFSKIFDNCKKVFLCSDVNGIYPIDPRIIRTTHISNINKKIAYILSQMGCKKLNINCIVPILDNDIELIIKNTNNDEKYTLINNNSEYNYKVFIKVDKTNQSYQKIADMFSDTNNEYLIIIGKIDKILENLHLVDKKYISCYKYDQHTIIFKISNLDDDIMKEFYNKFIYL